MQLRETKKRNKKENKKEKERKRKLGSRAIGTPSKSKGAINVIGVGIPDFLIILKR
jgi:hypothetical protein